METQLQELLKKIGQLSDQFAELQDEIRKAVSIADDDPEMALVRARRILEYVIHDVFKRLVKEPPGTRPLENLVQRLLKDGHLPARLEAYTETIRKLGNVGAHRLDEVVTRADVYRSLTDLLPILEWYFEAERPEAGVGLGPPPRAATEASRPPRPDGSPESGIDARVVPKGLRSFDANDSEFFLQLLPGPRDKDGLPESLRFWKYRIEAVDELAFTVGVIYGPSGCGKSSMMKAGLLPRLANRIIRIYVEATSDETETKLLHGLRKRVPGLPRDLDLTSTITALGHSQGLRPNQKVLVVLDQFEQWLHARRRERDTELARALRQCDGEHVQCITMVRDDFFTALTRFMEDLDIDILLGRNAALVDLFDLTHARKVLAEFGRAYGRLPEEDRALEKDREQFLTQASEGLAQDGLVVPIRLALFAEMVKGKPWTPATFKEVGGAEGVGVSFLKETFGSTALKNHQQAAQGVLKALLPESGTTIKGHMRTHEELAAASGYGSRPKELDNLLRTLDEEVRLITPTDPEGEEREGVEGPSASSRFYQLTHDYLVPSIRHWLTLKQRETRRGRAELRLADRAALWDAKPENRHLPGALEWATIRLLTRKREWTKQERRMMRRAGRAHGLSSLVWTVVVTGLVVMGLMFYADSLVRQLLNADIAKVPEIARAMQHVHVWTDPALKRVLAEKPGDRDRKLHSSIALLPVDPAQLPFLEECLLTATPAELFVLRDALKPYQTNLTPKLWSVLDLAKPGDARVLPSAGALAVCDPEDARWGATGSKVAQALVTVNSLLVGPWRNALRPVRARLTAPLATIFQDKEGSETARSLATDILADYADDDPALLAELVMVADPKPYSILFPIAQRQAPQFLPLFQAEIARKAGDPEVSEDAKDQLAMRQARAAVALVRLGNADEVWPLLRHSPDPRLRSFIVNWLNPLGADPKSLAAELDRIDSAHRSVVASSSPRPAERGEGGRRPGEGSSIPALAGRVSDDTTSAGRGSPDGVGRGSPHSARVGRGSPDPALTTSAGRGSPDGVGRGSPDPAPTTSAGRGSPEGVGRGSPEGVGRGSPEGVGRGSPDPAQGPDRRSPASGVAADSERPSVPGRAGSGDPRPTPAGVAADSERPSVPGRAGSGDPRPTPAGVAADSGRPSVPGRAGSGDPRPTLAAGSGDPRPTVANAMDAILFHPETSIRRALILALGTFAADRLSPGERQPLADKLLDLYRDDPDAGVHGAAEWTLRQWRQQEKLKATQAELTKVKEWGGRHWYVNSQGQTFVIVAGPVEFRMGSPASEPNRDAREISHLRVIPRRFAIADKEVTVRQYQDFLERNPQIARLEIDKYSPDPAGPMNGMTWFEAAAYCNWLSEQEGLPKANWCYVPNAAGAYAEGMTIPANVLERTGYRLPTEAEWECACRAGTMTSRYHGLSIDLLDAYARYQANSKDHAWPGGSLLPNDLGLSDMLGNVYEWCQDPYGSYQPGNERSIIDHITISESINEKNPRLLRGGSFLLQPAFVRSAYRSGYAPSALHANVGFRPARTYP